MTGWRKRGVGVRRMGRSYRVAKQGAEGGVFIRAEDNHFCNVAIAWGDRQRDNILLC